MTLLVVGLVLFLGMHLVPTVPGLRSRWVAVRGEQKYKGIFAGVSAIGLILVIIGFGRAPAEPRWFASFPLAVAIAPSAVTLSLVLFAAANMKTYIRAWIKHPMLIGLGLWALVHLLANGEARTTVMFGAFLAYAIIDLASAVQRRAVKTFQPEAKYDLMAVVGGVVVAVLIMLFHAKLFGVQATSWSM
jgi:uncharacterized membrane protein